MVILKDCAKKITEYSHEEFEPGESFNVAYGTDVNYQVGTIISVASIAENNKSIKCRFFIFSDGYSADFLDRIDLLTQQYKIKIELYEVDSELLRKLPRTSIWPVSIYYRLLAFDYLSQQINSLLYLDADVICKGSIDELVSLDFGEHYGAVVPDVLSIQEKTYQRLNVDFKDLYFNSGVMYVNLSQWKFQQLTSKVFSLLLDESLSVRLKYPDQDALNIVLQGGLIYLDRRFNTIYSLKSEFEFKDKNHFKKYISDSTVFIHYTGVTKPWHAWADYPASSFFRDIYLLTPWKNDQYFEAKSRSEYKEEYKHKLYQGKYLQAIKSVIAYKYKLYINK